MTVQDLNQPTDEKRRDWRNSAACRGVDTTLFFPGQGEPVGEAQDVCALCDVRVECVEFALESRQRFGIWGGTTERERRRLRAESRASAATQEVSAA